MIRELFEKKPYLKKIIIYVLLGIILIIIISTVLPLLVSTKMDYSKFEAKVKDAAIKYYEINEDELPKNSDQVKLSYSTLEKNKLIKPINKYIKNSEDCSVEVIVKNNGEDYYSYTPYLNCGDEYSTKELYKKILEDNEITTSGNGLYQIGNKYVFRGEDLNNYVSFADKVWRIIKIDDDNTIEMLDNGKEDIVVWDDRYNSEKGYNYGRNDYNRSRLKESLDKLYNNGKFFYDEEKALLTSKSYCLDAKNKDDNVINNSGVCNTYIENQYVGLLTVDEFLLASIDDKCISMNNNECQNYNYLAKNANNVSWWTITTHKDNTHQAFYISNSGIVGISNCSNSHYIKPVIYLSSIAMFNDGKGTIDEPYTLK